MSEPTLLTLPGAQPKSLANTPSMRLTPSLPGSVTPAPVPSYWRTATTKSRGLHSVSQPWGGAHSLDGLVR